jgi:hypothetical protein
MTIHYASQDFICVELLSFLIIKNNEQLHVPIYSTKKGISKNYKIFSKVNL